MSLFIFLLISTAFLLSVEIIKRKLSLSSNVTRKISHIGATSIAAVSPLFINKTLIVVACLGFAVVMYLSHKTSFFSSIHSVGRKTLGEVFLPLGEALSAIIFLPQSITAFQYGVLVMGVSDAFAGFVGEKYGKHQLIIFNNKKTIEGSIVFLLTTLVLTFIFVPSFGYHLIILPFVLTFIELILGYGMDNLVIPVIGSFLFSYFLHFSFTFTISQVRIFSTYGYC